MSATPDAPGHYDHLDFNAPLSTPRADGLAAALARRAPARVLDLGCGWGELLLRVLAAAPTATGVGVDQDARLLARARATAARRGLTARVEFVEGDASAVGDDASDRAEAVICCGAEHAWGGQVDALRALHDRVRPGGVLLFGTGFWRREPTPEQAAALGAVPADYPDLAGLVDLATGAGFRLLDLQTANEDEWNAFESGYLADWEEWLLTGPGHGAAEAAEAADRHRTQWLRGYRDVLGFAYLTLGVASTVA